MTFPLQLQRPLLVVGIVLLAAGVVYGFFDPAAFFEGYLTAFIFWITIALGCFGLLLIQYLTGGRWGMTLSRLFEAGMMTLPLCSLLFVPVLLGLPWLFPWVHPATAEIQHLVSQKSAYLNVPFYLIRNIVYFVVFGVLASRYRALSLRRSQGDLAAVELMQKWSGPTLIILVLLLNFAVIDWIMSLKPEWYSSMLVVEFGAEQLAGGLAFSILLLRFVSGLEPMRSILNEKTVHDLGMLLLGFTCFWTYVTFAEYLITWTGNLPREASWFADRSSAGWKLFAVLLVLVHFFLPLFCLIMTWITKNLIRLSRVAALLLFAHLIQVVWWILPGFVLRPSLVMTTLLLLVGVGAVWCAGLLRFLAAAPLLPAPLLQELDGKTVRA